MVYKLLEDYKYNHNLEIATGTVPGMQAVNKFGRNISVTSGTTHTIWDGGGVYSFPSTALMTSISQTTDQAAMRGQQIDVHGLDANWDLVQQQPTLDATDTTTVVTLATPLIRCFRMKVLADVVGDSDIMVHNAAASQNYAVIAAGNNQTLMAVYTVPNGKSAYMPCYYAHHNPATGQDPTSNAITLWASNRHNLYAAQNKHVVGLPNGSGFQHFFMPYLKFTQKEDIYITASPVGKDADVSAGYDLILLDN